MRAIERGTAYSGSCGGDHLGRRGMLAVLLYSTAALRVLGVVVQYWTVKYGTVQSDAMSSLNGHYTL